MSDERDATHEYLCKWTIENFTFTQDDATLSSPRFVVKLACDTNWRLNIDLEKDVFENGFHCYLRRDLEDGEDAFGLGPVEINNEISILTGDGSFEHLVARETSRLRMNSIGYPDIFNVSSVDGKDIKGLLKGNTLTICCRICNDKIIEPMQWFLRTRIETQKRTSMVSIDIDKQFFSQQLTYSLYDDELSLFMNFSWTEKSLTDKILQILINQDGSTSQWKVACVVSVLDSQGNPAVSQRGEFHFTGDNMEDCIEMWAFPPFLRRKWILDNKDTCLTTGTLNLRFEMEISNGRTTDEVERINFGVPSKSFAEEMDCVERHGEKSSAFQFLDE